MKKFNAAIDTIRREEYRLNYQSQKYLKNSRWVLLNNIKAISSTKRPFKERFKIDQGIFS